MERLHCRNQYKHRPAAFVFPFLPLDEYLTSRCGFDEFRNEESTVDYCVHIRSNDIGWAGSYSRVFLWRVCVSGAIRSSRAIAQTLPSRATQWVHERPQGETGQGPPRSQPPRDRARLIALARLPYAQTYQRKTEPPFPLARRQVQQFQR